MKKQSKVNNALKAAGVKVVAQAEKATMTGSDLKFKPFGGSVFTFEKDKVYIGPVDIGHNPYYGKGKNPDKQPEEVLTFQGQPCPTHFALMELATAIASGKVPRGCQARIVFRGVTGKGKSKFARYDTALAL